MYLSILNLVICEIVVGKKPAWLMLWTSFLVPSKGQNLICTMNSALEKSLLRHLKVLRKLSRSSEGDFMEKKFRWRNPKSVGCLLLQSHCDVLICRGGGCDSLLV